MPAQPFDITRPPELPKYGSDLVPPRGAEPESEIIGPVAGRYDLEERIAKGGMGIVYRAMDRLLNRTVAIKIIRTRFLERPDLLRRFLTEARINGRLQHPGIVPVYEVGTLPDARPFIAMKLVEGRTFSRLLRERTDAGDNLPHFLKVFEALCRTVAYAHQQGVIHRDLKPDNVMVGGFGEVQVMDWGLAKFLDPAAAFAPTPDGFEAVERSAYLSGDGTTPAGDNPTEVTRVLAVGPDTPAEYTTAGEVIGTLPYMPPEQARGESDRVDRRGDVFSLGAILCQVLTGQPPYFGAPETLRAQAREGKLFGAYILLDRCGAPPALVALAKRCLVVNPDERPADAGMLAALVTECLDGLQTQTRAIEVKRATAEARLAEAEARERLVRKARRLSRTLAVVGVLVAGFLVIGLSWYANDRQIRDAVEDRRRTAALEQIDVAMAEAAILDRQARRGTGGALVRDAAAKQALSAVRRAEAWIVTTPNPPAEVTERFAGLKGRVTETERGTRLAVALQWADSGQSDEALEVLRSAVTMDASAVAGHIRIGELLEQRGEADAARDSFLTALALAPKSASAQLGLGRTEFARGDWAAAEFAFRAATADGTLKGQAHAGLGRLRLKQWEAGKAADEFRAAVAVEPANVEYRLGLVEALRLANDYSAAVAEARSATGDIPKAPALHKVLGELLSAAGENRGAVATYRTAARCDPTDANNHLRLAELYQSLDDPARAANALEAAAHLWPNDTKVLLALAELRQKTGDHAAAREAYTQAVEVEPADVAVRQRFGRFLAARRDEPAIEQFAAAVKAQPESGELRAELGVAFSEFGRFREAAETLRDAADRLPADSPRRKTIESEARTAIKFAVLSDRLPRVLAGTLTPGSPADWAEFGEVARRTGRYAAAAQCYAAAAKEEKRYAGPAAVCAALAGFGRGSDANALAAAARAELRRSALAWFREAPVATAEPLLDGLKGPDALRDLPASERAAWRARWAGD
jgi:serine/threonine protein kinase/Tfp pilus assembly protein PilF